MLLGWLGRRYGRPAFGDAQRTLEAGVETLIAEPATRTRDLGGALGTRAFAAALCERLRGRR